MFTFLCFLLCSYHTTMKFSWLFKSVLCHIAVDCPRIVNHPLRNGLGDRNFVRNRSEYEDLGSTCHMRRHSLCQARRLSTYLHLGLLLSPMANLWYTKSSPRTAKFFLSVSPSLYPRFFWCPRIDVFCFTSSLRNIQLTFATWFDVIDWVWLSQPSSVPLKVNPLSPLRNLFVTYWILGNADVSWFVAFD